MDRSRQIVIAIFALLPLVVIGLLLSHASHYLSAVYHAGKAPALARSGRLEEAVAESRQAVREDPQLAMGHNNLGYYLFKQGKFTEAEAECRKAVSLAPRDAYAHDSLGQILSHTGRADEAVDQCRQAVQLRPSAVHVNSLAYALSKQGRWDEAQWNWQQVTLMNNPEAAAEAQAMLAQMRK